MTQHQANAYPVPKTMKAWVLGNSEELMLVEKPVPEPGPAEAVSYTHLTLPTKA